MDIDTYLWQKRESLAAFSRRTGVSVGTLQLIKGGKTRCRIDVAHAIVKASEADPVDDWPEGGTITFEDLVPTEGKANG